MCRTLAKARVRDSSASACGHRRAVSKVICEKLTDSTGLCDPSFDPQDFVNQMTRCELRSIAFGEFVIWVRVADRVGFEPTVTFLPHTLSKRAHSTTLTPVRIKNVRGRSVGTFRAKTLCCKGFLWLFDGRPGANAGDAACID